MLTRETLNTAVSLKAVLSTQRLGSLTQPWFYQDDLLCLLMPWNTKAGRTDLVRGSPQFIPWSYINLSSFVLWISYLVSLHSHSSEFTRAGAAGTNNVFWCYQKQLDSEERGYIGRGSVRTAREAAFPPSNCSCLPAFMTSGESRTSLGHSFLTGKVEMTPSSPLNSMG